MRNTGHPTLDNSSCDIHLDIHQQSIDINGIYQITTNMHFTEINGDMPSHILPQHSLKVNSNEGSRSSGRKRLSWWTWINLSCYFFGSGLFIIGSICFYPQYGPKGIRVGATLFEIGCVAFLVGTLQDLVMCFKRFIKPLDRQEITEQELQMLHHTELGLTIINVLAAVCFVVGGIYFIPEVYATNDYLGCWAFIVGCVLFQLSSLAGVCRLHRDLLSSTFVCSGSMVFIIASVYFLPDFLITDEDVKFAVNLFILGSILFTLGAIVDILTSFDMIRPFNPWGITTNRE